MTRYDVIVAGLGAMGCATAAHLALRGKKVLGLERWQPGHAHGSSHGDSRIIREMYFEHPMYVPMILRAHELWRELEARTGESLMTINGGLMIGPAEGALVKGTLRSAREHALPHEILSREEVAKLFPPFSLRDVDVAVRDPRAGFLDPEACNAAHLGVAALNGADLRFDDPLGEWSVSGDGVSVRAASGTYAAEHLVIAVGARTRRLLGGFDIPLEVERQAVFWLEPEGQSYDASRFPIWAHEYMPGEICYGFPRLPRGVKASVMHSGQIVADADAVNREVSDEEVEPLRAALAGVLPELSGARIREKGTCLFTNTPDHDFVVDFHPEHPQVIVSSPCSGHGFKFASVIGEIQADLVTAGRSRFDLSPFRIGRW